MVGDTYVINADGTGLIQLAAHAGNPAWSPNGTKIAFTAYHADDTVTDVSVMNADGTGIQRLLDNGSSPVWSPDGSQIIFTSERDGNFEIYLINADGSDVRRLTDNNSWELDLDWGRKPESL
jgi:TolB protein